MKIEYTENERYLMDNLGHTHRDIMHLRSIRNASETRYARKIAKETFETLKRQTAELGSMLD